MLGVKSSSLQTNLRKAASKCFFERMGLDFSWGDVLVSEKSAQKCLGHWQCQFYERSGMNEQGEQQ